MITSLSITTLGGTRHQGWQIRSRRSRGWARSSGSGLFRHLLSLALNRRLFCLWSNRNRKEVAREHGTHLPQNAKILIPIMKLAVRGYRVVSISWCATAIMVLMQFADVSTKASQQNQVRQKRSRSKPRQPSLEHDSSSDQSDDSQQSRHARSQSHFNSHPSSDPACYPYAQPPYHPQQHPPHMYDPRAQFIISQAMHQLSALVAGGPWTPPGPRSHTPVPYTPTHHHQFPRHSGSGRSQTMYITPTHHPHPYPYVYDPAFSGATMPPDSPELHSSLTASGIGDGVRRKSLVGRSRSRGRRVSFHVEEVTEVRDEDQMDVHYSPSISDSRRKKREGSQMGKGHGSSDESSPSRNDASPKPHRKAKAEGKVKVAPKHKPSQNEDEDDSEPRVKDRGRSFRRAQTPGPSVPAEETDPPSSPNHSRGSRSMGRGRSRSVSRPLKSTNKR